MHSFLVFSILVISQFCCTLSLTDSSNDDKILHRDDINPFRYQITLWLSLFIIAILFVTIFTFIDSSTIRDPNLYMQNRTTNIERKEL